MDYEHVFTLPSDAFRRLTGILPDTFQVMMEVLETADKKRKATHRYKGGRPAKLSLENQLLLTLGCWREYRTMFHIAQSFGVSESVGWRTLHWIEDTLIKSRRFSLPGKKALLKPEVEWTLVVVDATETPIERPKKSKTASILARKSGIR